MLEKRFYLMPRAGQGKLLTRQGKQRDFDTHGRRKLKPKVLMICFVMLTSLSLPAVAEETSQRAGKTNQPVANTKTKVTPQLKKEVDAFLGKTADEFKTPYNVEPAMRPFIKRLLDEDIELARKVIMHAADLSLAVADRWKKRTSIPPVLTKMQNQLRQRPECIPILLDLSNKFQSFDGMQAVALSLRTAFLAIRQKHNRLLRKAGKNGDQEIAAGVATIQELDKLVSSIEGHIVPATFMYEMFHSYPRNQSALRDAINADPTPSPFLQQVRFMYEMEELRRASKRPRLSAKMLTFYKHVMGEKRWSAISRARVAMELADTFPHGGMDAELTMLGIKALGQCGDDIRLSDDSSALLQAFTRQSATHEWKVTARQLIAAFSGKRNGMVNSLHAGTASSIASLHFRLGQTDEGLAIVDNPKARLLLYPATYAALLESGDAKECATRLQKHIDALSQRAFRSGSPLITVAMRAMADKVLASMKSPQQRMLASVFFCSFPIADDGKISSAQLVRLRRKCLGTALTAYREQQANVSETVRANCLRTLQNGYYSLAADKLGITPLRHRMPLLIELNTDQLRTAANKDKKVAAKLAADMFRRLAVALSTMGYLSTPPFSSSARSKLSQIKELGLSDRVLSELKTGSKRDDADALFAYGLALKACGKVSSAKSRFEKVLKLAPEHSGAHYELVLMDAYDDLDAAFSHFDHVNKLYPNEMMRAMVYDSSRLSYQERLGLARFAVAVLKKDAASEDGRWLTYLLSSHANRWQIPGKPTLESLVTATVSADPLDKPHRKIEESREDLYLKLCDAGIACQSTSLEAFQRKREFLEARGKAGDDGLLAEAKKVLLTMASKDVKKRSRYHSAIQVSNQFSQCHPVEIVVGYLVRDKKTAELDAFIEQIKATDTAQGRTLARALSCLKGLYTATDDQFLDVARTLELPHWAELIGKSAKYAPVRTSIARAYTAMRAIEIGRRKINIIPFVLASVEALAKTGRPTDSKQLIKAWGDMIARHNNPGLINDFLIGIVKTMLTESEQKTVLAMAPGMLKSSSNRDLYTKVYSMQLMVLELVKTPGFVLPILDVVGPYITRIREDIYYAIRKGLPRNITWDWLSKTNMAAEVGTFRLYRLSPTRYLLPYLTERQNSSVRKRLLKELKKTDKKTFGSEFIYAMLQKDSPKRFAAICNLCGKNLDSIKTAGEVSQAEITGYVLYLRSRYSASKKTKLTDDGLKFLSHCATIENQRVLSKCKAFLKVTPDANLNVAQIRERTVNLVVAALPIDLKTALDIFEHGLVLLTQEAEQPGIAAKPDFVKQILPPVLGRIRELPNAAPFLMKVGTKHNSIAAILLASDALKSQYRTTLERVERELRIQDRNLHFDQRQAKAMLTTLKRIVPKLSNDDLYPAHFVMMDIYRADRDAFDEVEKWLRANEAGSNFVRQVRFCLELSRQQRAEGQQLRLTDEMQKFYNNALRNARYHPAARFALFAGMVDQHGLSTGMADLAIPAVDALLQCEQKGAPIKTSALLQTVEAFAAANVTNEWKTVANLFLEATKSRVSSTRISDLASRRFALHYAHTQLKLGQTTAALTLLEDPRILSDPRTFVVALDGNLIEWCAQHLPAYAAKAEIAPIALSTHDALDPQQRETADKVIVAAKSPAMRLYASLFYASLYQARRGNELGTTSIEPQRERLGLHASELVKMSETLPPEFVKKCFYTFFSNTDVYDKTLLPLILKFGKVDYSELWSSKHSGERRARQRVFVRYWKALAAIGKVKEATELLAKFKDPPALNLAWEYAEFCRSLTNTIGQHVRDNGLPAKTTSKDWWQLCRTLCKIAAGAKYNHGHIYRKDFVILTMVTAYLSGETTSFETFLKSDAGKLFKKNVGEDARYLARIYVKVHPLAEQAQRAEATRYVEGFLELRTHPAYAQFLESRYSGIEEIIEAGPLAADADYWQLKAAEVLWSKGMKSGARRIAATLMQNTQNATIRRRAENLIKFGRVGPRFNTFKTPFPEVRWIAAVASGKTLLTAARDPEIAFLDAATGNVIRRQKLTGNIDAIAVAPNGETWVSSSDRGEILLHTSTKEAGAPVKLSGHTKKVYAFSFSSDSKLLASASLDASVRIWDLGQKKQIHEFRTKRGLRAVRFLPDGKHVAAGGLDREVYVWKIGAPTPIDTFKGHTFGIRDLAVSSDGKHILSAADDMTIRLWQIGKAESVLAIQGHSSLVTHVVFLDGGKKALSSSLDGTLRTWDLTTGKALTTLEVNEEGINGFTFGSGKSIYVAGRAGKIYLVNTSDIKPPSTAGRKSPLPEHPEPKNNKAIR